ncbi:MAG TPA: hypothetical protein VJM50_18085 [Pyrinomonadaceae bacterium]|nr:hypothetical protein [Pyrinomonadaceae bacterium]
MSTKVKIVEQYYDYRPPVGVYGSVEVLLRYVPEEHLEGLRTITVTNSAYMGKALRGKFTQEKRRFRSADCRGMYWGGEIWLILDKICDAELLVIIPPLRTFFLGEVLYHEIGHHIHAMQQPGFKKDKEAFADEWRDRLMGSFLRQRYWYLHGVLKLFKPRKAQSLN